MSGLVLLLLGAGGGLLVGAAWVKHGRAWRDWRGLVAASRVARDSWWRLFLRLVVTLLLAAVFLGAIVYLKQTGRPPS